MSDLIQRLKDAYTANPASALAMLPELFQAEDGGKIVDAPEKVYQINGYWCEICQKYHLRVAEKTVGKTVFLTREAAENALKEREASGTRDKET